MKITVRKCPWTGKLFESDKAYAKHILQIRTKMREVREQARFSAAFDEWIAPIYLFPSTTEIADWLNANYMKVHTHIFGQYEPRRKSAQSLVSQRKIMFQISDCFYNKQISTSHHAPRGMKSNFCQPSSETGWRGRITIRFEGDGYSVFDTKALQAIGINTGSGGGSERGLRYDLILFSKDFENLWKIEALNKLRVKAGWPELDGGLNEKPVLRRNLY